MPRKRGKRLNPETFDIADIYPLTDNQKLAFKSDKNLVLCGSAGCGKSFLSCYFAVSDISSKEYRNIVLIRSAVPSRDIGFLPGTQAEKTRVYEEPYYSIFAELLGRGDSYDILKQKGLLQFTTTSFLRGLTVRDSVIIIDEVQNMAFTELNTIMTRVGENCRVIFCGDFKQADLKNNGMQQFLSIINALIDDFDIIEFNQQDIVRSGLVKRYLIASDKLGY